MVTDIDLVLSDEFVSYSKKITQIVAQRKIKIKEYQSFKDKIQQEINELNSQARNIHNDFEKWKQLKRGDIGSPPSVFSDSGIH